MKKYTFLLSLLISLASAPLWAETSSLPTEASLNTQLAEAQKLADNPTKTSLINDLQASLDFLKQIAAQRKLNTDLQTLLNSADAEIQKNSQDIQNIKKQLEQPIGAAYPKMPLDDAQTLLTQLTAQQQETQSQMSETNSSIATQGTLSERAQTVLTESSTRSQELTKLLGANNLGSATAQKYQLEQALIGLKTTYNQELLKNSDQLTLLYQSRYNELGLKSQLLQSQIAALQEVINQKNLAQTQSQVEQVQQQQTTAQTRFIQSELDKNTQLSQFLLKQTETTNQLTQDDLKMRNVLDSLKQTQRTIDEQISALQGTLVLSRIIQQQKQKLPTKLDIKGLSKQISDLRVQIFDFTQNRNELYDLDGYINNLAKDENQTLSASETTQLKKLLEERRTMASDLIKTLNNQLNLAINLELTQKQITQISDQLQEKLDQQSFWVKSNNPIDWDWLTRFPMLLKSQLHEIGERISLQTNLTDLPWLLIFTSILAVIGGLIFKFKKRITQYLTKINSSLNTLRYDNQWNTPVALVLTAILALPSVLWFLAVSLLVGFFIMRNPMDMWDWAFRMAGYWWFFSFLLALLRPHGIALQHFGFSADNVAKSKSVAYRMCIAVTLLLNTSVFSSVAEGGLTNDVLGEINTIAALIFTVFIIAPRFKKAIDSFNGTTQGGSFAASLLRVLSIVTPIVLTVLVVLGYYYTTLDLINHIISTYIAWCCWMWIRQTIYRAITVASRRLTHRRLIEKREQAVKMNQEIANSDDIVAITEADEGLALNEVRGQIKRIADILLWSALFGILYYVWADLITVANYLRGVELWTQTTITDAGTVTESITLFNGLVALLIVAVTYALVRNISGMLEVLVFSRFKFSQGTPYTITTLITYIIIAVGGAWAFATLGMSWSKLQWLFAALSVGLGFGMQEIFANFVSGLILLFERPIRVGDTITINGVTGTVSKIRIRAITIIDADRKEVIVPNKSFVTGQVINWALSNTVTRLIVTIGVAYGSDLELVKRLLLQAAEEQSSVLKDPKPQALFLSFGASTLDHELRLYVGQLSERTSTIDALNRRINQLFAEHNIDIAFNQLDVFIKNNDTGAEIPLVESNKAS